MIGSWATLDKEGALLKVVEKVGEIYENYGIDPRSMDEAGLVVIYDYYLRKLNELEEDLARSRKHAGKFDDDIL